MNIDVTSGPGVWKGDSAALEKIVREVWCEVLSRAEIGATDNFFELGGRSMHVIMMTNGLKDRVGFDVSPSLIFQAQTISEVVATLMTADRPREMGLPGL